MVVGGCSLESESTYFPRKTVFSCSGVRSKSLRKLGKKTPGFVCILCIVVPGPQPLEAFQNGDQLAPGGPLDPADRFETSAGTKSVERTLVPIDDAFAEGTETLRVLANSFPRTRIQVRCLTILSTMFTLIGEPFPTISLAFPKRSGTMRLITWQTGGTETMNARKGSKFERRPIAQAPVRKRR